MSRKLALNYQLTAFAQGHANDMSATQELPERLMPTVPVHGNTGQYKTFNSENSFNTYNTSRARGGDPTRISFGMGDGTFDCKPQALEVTIDNEDHNDAGDSATGMLNPAEIGVKALINAQMLSHVKVVTDFVITTLATPYPGFGVWSNPDIDPIDQLDEVIDVMGKRCGSLTGLKVTMDLSSWRAIRNHPKTKARCSGVQVGGISLTQLDSILAVPVDCKVYSISYNDAKLGATVNKKRVLQGHVLLTYSVPSPTQYDPSAFKRFTRGVSGVMGVRSWEAPNGLYEGHLMDWSEDLKQTSTIAAERIAVS